MAPVPVNPATVTVSPANIVWDATVWLTLISQRPAGPLAKSINDTIVQVATPDGACSVIPGLMVPVAMALISSTKKLFWK